MSVLCWLLQGEDDGDLLRLRVLAVESDVVSMVSRSSSEAMKSVVEEENASLVVG